MKAIKFLLVWAAGLFLMHLWAFKTVAAYVDDGRAVALLMFLSIFVWTTISAIVATSK